LNALFSVLVKALHGRGSFGGVLAQLGRETCTYELAGQRYHIAT
jgi:hypothetical protein